MYMACVWHGKHVQSLFTTRQACSKVVYDMAEMYKASIWHGRHAHSLMRTMTYVDVREAFRWQMDDLCQALMRYAKVQGNVATLVYEWVYNTTLLKYIVMCVGDVWT